MYTYTCIPTLLLAHLSSCLPANLPTCLPPAYVLTCLPAYPPIHTHLPTYVLMYARADEHVRTCMCTYARTQMHSCLPTYLPTTYFRTYSKFILVNARAHTDMHSVL